MAERLDLHDAFIDVLGTREAEQSRVYFNPPASVKMLYPCIKYSLSGINMSKANDKIYRSTNRYQVIVIDPDPDSDIHMSILHRFPMCSFDTEYVADNLNHKVLTLYY